MNHSLIITSILLIPLISLSGMTPFKYSGQLKNHLPQYIKSSKSPNFLLGTHQPVRPFILEFNDKTKEFSYSNRPELYDYITNVPNHLLTRIRMLHDKYGFAKMHNYLWWKDYSEQGKNSLNEKEFLSKLKLYRALKRQDDTVFPRLDWCSQNIEELLDGPDCNPKLICHSLNIFFNYIESLYDLLVFRNKTRATTEEERIILDLFIKNYQLSNIFTWAIIPILLRLPINEASQLFREIINSSYFKYFSEEEQSIIQNCMIKKTASINELYQE